MPTYTFEDKDTGETETVILTLSEREQYLKDNPNKRQLIVNSNGFIAGVSMKPDNVFRDMLKEMKKVNPGSTIDTF